MNLLLDASAHASNSGQRASETVSFSSVFTRSVLLLDMEKNSCSRAPPFSAHGHGNNDTANNSSVTPTTSRGHHWRLSGRIGHCQRPSSQSMGGGRVRASVWNSGAKGRRFGLRRFATVGIFVTKPMIRRKQRAHSSQGSYYYGDPWKFLYSVLPKESVHFGTPINKIDGTMERPWSVDSRMTW